MKVINIQEQDARRARLEDEIRKSGTRDLHRTFFCPILYREEETQLCKGHVIPKSLGSGFGWVVQRADVDNFFGTVAEEKFAHGVKLRGLDVDDAIGYVASNKLGHLVRPSIIDSQGNEQPVRLGSQDGEIFGSIVRKTGDSALDLKNPVSIRFGMDVQSETILALIHSLHLGLFKKMGYRYVDSQPGRFNASVLHDAFAKLSSNKELRKDPAALKEICAVHRNMVRPVFEQNLDPRLLRDPFSWFLVCWHGSSPFATIHFLETKGEVNAVMNYLNIDARATAFIESLVPLSFKTTKGHLRDEGYIEVGSVKEETPSMVWICGDGSISIDRAVQAVVEKYSEKAAS